MSRVLGRLGVGLTLAAAVALLVVPMYGGITQTFSASVGPDGQVGPEVTSQVVSHATLVEVNGRWVLIPLGLLVLFAVVAAWGRPRWMRWVGVGLFGALTVLGALSIGAFFLPALLCLLLSVALAMGDQSSASLRAPNLTVG